MDNLRHKCREEPYVALFSVMVIQINLPSYDEKLNYIKEAERMNSSQITKSEMADVFELSEQQVNDIATAA